MLTSLLLCITTCFLQVTSRPALFTITRVTARARESRDVKQEDYSPPHITHDDYAAPPPKEDYAAPGPKEDYAAPSPCSYKPATTTTTTTTTTTEKPKYSAGKAPGPFAGFLGFTKGLLEGVGDGVKGLHKVLLKHTKPKVEYDCLEAPKDAKYEAPKEASYEAPKEATYEAPKDTTYEAPKEATYEAPKVTEYEAPKEAVYEAPVEPAYEAPKKIAYQDPEEPILKDTTYFAPKEAAYEAPKKNTYDEPILTSTYEAVVEPGYSAPK